MRKQLNLVGAYVKKKNICHYILIIFLYLVIIFFFYPGLFLDFSTKIPFGYQGDVKNILGIINFSIHTPLNYIYHLPIFYPESFVLVRTHPLFGISLFFKLFNLLGLNLQQGNNLYILLSLVLGALGCYLLTREFSNSWYFPFIFSVIYIIHRWTLGHFIWLNFLSCFYIPYIFLFFIRFFKTRRKVYIVLASVLAFYQFFSSIYYGVHLWIFLIPAFLIFAVILKLLTFRDFLKLLLALSIGLAFIIFIFQPYATIAQPTLEKDSSRTSISGTDLFSYSRILLLFFDYPEKLALNLFPGFTFFLFLIFFLVSGLNNKKMKTFMFIALVVLTTVMVCLAFFNAKILDIVFIIFLFLILTVVIVTWKRMIKWEKLILLTFSFYFILFLKFEGLYFLNEFSFFEFLNGLLPLEGLSAMRRTYLIILPFLIILAGIGGAKFLESLGHMKKKKVLVLSAFIFCFMILENIPLPLPITKRQLMKPLPHYNLEVYQKLPFKKNKIILEIPFYFRMVTRNSIFFLNWQFHQNYLLNGKTSLEPHRYFSGLKSIIGRLQKKFPDETALKLLIQNYSVDYIIFHWELLSRYQHDPKTKEKTMRKINSIRKYGEVVYNENNATILRIQENIPVDAIIRTYSLYHLKNNRLEVTLKEPYLGEVSIFFNNQLLGKRYVESRCFDLIFEANGLEISGNRIELKFDKPVMLYETKLKKTTEDSTAPVKICVK